MKPRHQPRPDFIYREETQNELGEWVCSRMTYDVKKFNAWRDGYLSYIAKFGSSYPGGPKRYATGKVTWTEG